MIENNEDRQICAECGGECCKRMPGIFSPEQLGAPNREKIKDNLMAFLKTSKYAIDWWEGDPRVDIDEDDEVWRAPYIRPATVDKIGVFEDPSWGGECCMLTESGCYLAWDERPEECQGLIPQKGGRCRREVGRNKRELSVAWLPFADIIDDVLEELRE